MRHFVSVVMLAAALAVYVLSVGPLFFGLPILGIVLFVPAAILEAAAWSRLLRKAPAQG